MVVDIITSDEKTAYISRRPAIKGSYPELTGIPLINQVVKIIIYPNWEVKLIKTLAIPLIAAPFK